MLLALPATTFLRQHGEIDSTGSQTVPYTPRALIMKSWSTADACFALGYISGFKKGCSEEALVLDGGLNLGHQVRRDLLHVMRFLRVLNNLDWPRGTKVLTGCSYMLHLACFSG
jgi:hypothetical protein